MSLKLFGIVSLFALANGAANAENYASRLRTISPVAVAHGSDFIAAQDSPWSSSSNIAVESLGGTYVAPLLQRSKSFDRAVHLQTEQAILGLKFAVSRRSVTRRSIASNSRSIASGIRAAGNQFQAKHGT